MVEILKKNIGLLLFIFIIGISSRLPLVEKMQSHWDGPQYSIAILNYSLEQETPAPPGYPLYIALAKVFYIFIGDPHQALLIISILAAGLGGVVVFLAGGKIFNKKVGVISSLLFLSGPTFYFFSLTAYAYSLTPIIATCFALIVFQIINKKILSGLLLGAIFSFALGFRIQDAFFLTPLFILGLYYLSMKEKIMAVLGFTILSLGWFIPLLIVVGGFEKYIEISKNFASSGALPGLSLSHIKMTIETLVKGVFLSFGISSLSLAYYIYTLTKKSSTKNLRYIVLFACWILPSFLFNLFIRSDHAGHQMTYLSGVLLLIAYALCNLTRKNTKLLWPVVTLCLVFNLYTFFRDRDPQNIKPYIPTSFHYSEIRKNDTRMSSKIKYVRENYNPENTIILTTSELWRPYMYYLKNYQVLGLDGLTTNNYTHKSIRRESYMWGTTTSYSTTDHLQFKRIYEYIILLGNEESIILKNIIFKEVRTKANGRITIIDLNKESELHYGYNTIKYIK